MKQKQRAKQKLKKNLRWHALILLDQIENHQQYSNVIVDEFLNESPLEYRDDRLLVQIVYGVVQNKKTIDYYLHPFIKGKKIEPWVESLLQLSVYQLIYLDRIPNHAIVNEAVDIAKNNGHGGLGNFVNAILRNFMRQDLRDIQGIEDMAEKFSIQYSIDKWIVDYFLEKLEHEEAEKMIASLQWLPHLSARVNTNLIGRDDLIDHLAEEEGIIVEKSELSDYGIIAKEGNLINSQAFVKGWLTIQDESSMLVAPLGRLDGHERALDACAAPGGKATHIAQLLTEGHLDALDISQRKLERVNEHLLRLKLDDKVTLYHEDATKYIPNTGEKYDIIYLDAPCSGLGLMRRKPEIKYEKTYQDVTELANIQNDLLNHMATLVKDNGIIVYSTCTMTLEENEQVLDRFLKAHPDFEHMPVSNQENIPESLITSDGNVRVWPHQYKTDGFFIGRLIKKSRN